MLLQHFGKVDGLVEIPTAGGPVGCGNAHQHRHGVGHDGTHAVHDLDQHADAVFERSAILILTLVDQWIEELRQQIAVGRMNFHRVKADIISTPSGIAELVDNGMDLVNGQRARLSQRTKRVGAWPHGLPTALLLRHALMLETNGEAAGGGLTSGMVELHRHGGTGGLRIGNDPTPCIHLLVGPQSQVARRNTALRRHCGGFHDNHAETAHGTRHIMLIVEWRGQAILGQRGIRVHRRQPDAVAHGHATQGHRIEQANRAIGFDLLRPLRFLFVFAHRSSSPPVASTGFMPIS